MRKLISVGLVSFVLWPFLFVPMSNAMSPEKRSDIIKLLKISGTMTMAKKMAHYSSNQLFDVYQKNRKDLTPRAIEIIREEVSMCIDEQMYESQAFFNLFVPIYDKYYTHNEIKGLISFYESDLGKKTVQVMSSLSNELFAAGEKWGNSIAQIAVERVLKKFEAEGVKYKK